MLQQALNFETAKDAQRPLDCLVMPGREIEILARKVFSEETWVRYRVEDLEEPRLDDKGRWLFTATMMRPHMGPNPMVVDPERIRAA